MFTRICVFFLVFYLLFNWNVIKRKQKGYASSPYILYFLLAPIMTHISCYISHSQSIVSSLTVSAATLVLSIYFFCILKGTEKEKIIKLLIILALLRTVITLIEQFTYPNILFSFSVDTYDDYGNFKEIDMRSGFRRFIISDAYYLPVFLGFYSLAKFLNNRQKKYIILFAIACLGIYMDQTRQIIFVFLLCILLTPFFVEKKSSNMFFRASVAVLFIIGILYYNYDTLFGELTNKTSEQFHTEYTRSVEMSFFLSRMGGVLTVLFGNGWFGTSSYGQEYISLQAISKMYRCDVGVVGAAHMLGVIFIIVFLFYIIRMLWKYRRFLPMEYKLMYLFTLLDLPLIFPLYNFTLNSVECFMGLLFYIADKSIQEYKGMYLASKKQ